MVVLLRFFPSSWLTPKKIGIRIPDADSGYLFDPIWPGIFTHPSTCTLYLLFITGRAGEAGR